MQVPREEIKNRVRNARGLGETVWKRVARRQVGHVERVLVENTEIDHDNGDTTAKGRAPNYFPVWFQCDSVAAGEWIDVRITGFADAHLLAQPMV